MTVLFQEGLPAEGSSVKSADIRNNFAALYDKLQTLEARASAPESTVITVLGGPVYFRSGTSVLYDNLGSPVSGKLQFISFQTSTIDLSTANGFQTIKNPDGTQFRLPISGGVSPFTTAGLFREILITLTPQGRLTFTEGATTTTGLSRPFDIAFDDSEIPVCLIVIQQGGTLNVPGQLKPVTAIDITDVRPFVTSAFQNNLTAASLQSIVSDSQTRITALETTISVTDTLKVRIPPVEKLTADGYLTSNIRLEVISGSTYIGSKLVRYPGGYVNVNQNLTTPIPVDDFNIALVALRDDGYVTLTHGSSSDANSQRNLVKLPLAIDDGYLTTSNPSQRNGILRTPTNLLPLALVYYRAISTPALGTTTSVKPVVSNTFVDPTFNGNQVTGGIRFNYALDIVGINSSFQFVVQIPTDVDNTVVYLVGQFVDLLDDNTRPLRRTITQRLYNAVTGTMTVTVSDSFVDDVNFPGTAEGISLKRHPKAVAVSQHQLVVEDVRPFVTR